MKEFLKILLDKRSFPHSSIFVGKSINRIEQSVKFVMKYFYCKGENKPCDDCINCKKVEKEIHPDVKIVECEENAKNIKINQIRELQEFCYFTSENEKIIYIRGAHLMSIEAENALLKILEEPGEKNYFILSTTNKYKLLPTILSRCVHFNIKPESNYYSANLDFEYSEDFLEDVKYENLKNLSFFEINEKLLFLLKEIGDIEKLLKLIIVENSKDYISQKRIKFVEKVLEFLSDLKFNQSKDSIIGMIAFLIKRLERES